MNPRDIEVAEGASRRPPAPAPRGRLRQGIGLILVVAGILGITPMWGVFNPSGHTSILHLVGSTLLTLAGVVVFTFERLPAAPDLPEE